MSELKPPFEEVTVPPLIPGGPPSIGDLSRDPKQPPDSQPVSLRQKITPVLTKLAHGSAPFLTTFVLIHLTAPALANLGGTSLSSQVMLLGREYYQTSFGEKYLLLLPFAIHTSTSIAKRLITPKRSTRSLRSLLSITGYVALLVFVPIHYLTHRVYPTDPSPPIYSIGPSELDYEFAKVAVETWPWRSWLLYGGLTLGVAWHMAEGANIIYTTWFKGKGGLGAGTVKIGKLQVRQRVIGATLAFIPALTGLWMISTEPIMAFSSTILRFQEVLKKSFIFRL
ncbi:hypothetical protein ABKN59_009336 [Abortiporus biennis]